MLKVEYVGIRRQVGGNRGLLGSCRVRVVYSPRIHAANPSDKETTVQSTLPAFQACHEGTQRVHGCAANLPLTRTPGGSARQSERQPLAEDDSKAYVKRAMQMPRHLL